MKPNYKNAIIKLEEIIEKIEHEDVDVDELADHVKQAVELIRLCKEKIEKAEVEVKKIVEDLEQENE